MPQLRVEKYLVEAGMRQGRILRGISARTQAMRKRAIEGLDFDFKQTVKSLEQDDIVAFASSRNGGVIICGIKDSTSTVIGCGNSTPKSIDGNKLSILNKAAECDPPISVVVDVENVNRNKPIFVVHIPEMNGLCSTRSGRYLKREDGRNVRISPTEIKARVLESEAEEFTRRLEAAAKHLEDQMRDIDDRIFDLNSTVESYEGTLNDTAMDIINDTSGSVEVFTDAMIADVMAKLDGIEGELSHENGAVARYVLLVEKLTNALLLAVSDKTGASIEELLVRADAEVIKRHSLASPESGGAGVRWLFEHIAEDLEKNTGKVGVGEEYVKRCLVGSFLLSRCPHCGVRDYPFHADWEQVDLKVISASPMQLEMKCPRCGGAVEHAEELITSKGW